MGDQRILGNGLYILADVARLTELHPNRVRSWFKPRSDTAGQGPVFQSDYRPVDNDYAVSFHNLIDVLVAGQLRESHGVPMRVVRRAHALLQQQLGVKHPFCHSEIHTDGKRIFRSAASTLGEETLSDVVSRQQFFVHIKEKLDHIDYSEINQLAHRWRIAEGVVVDPSINMGQPTVENTGIMTRIITSQYYANSRDHTLVADLYGVSDEDVLKAVQFEGRYGRRYAA